MTGHTIAARVAAVLVALVAGSASYSHIVDVATGAGERAAVALALPLAIDGLIVVGVAALLEDRRRGLRPRGVARLAVLVGVVATLAANIASAEPSWTARLVAVAAPVCFLLSVEVLTRSGRPRDVTPAPEPVTRKSQPAEVAASGHGRKAAGSVSDRDRSGAPRRRGQAAGKVAAAMAASPDASVAELARLAGVSRSTVRRVNGRKPELEPAGAG